MNKIIEQNFIGPKAEQMGSFKILINILLDHHEEWRKSYYKNDDSITSASYPKHLEKELKLFLKRSEKNLPYFHPRYSAQMLKDPSIPTILGYLTFMLSNPNNHAYEGGPVTTEMEMEVTGLMLKMIGYKKGWGHLASGGSLANMEALWAARDYYKKGAVYFSEVSHYSWKRICSILRIEKFNEIFVDKNFRMDPDHLEKNLKKNKGMFVVANFGSTGTGSIDDIEALLELKKKYNFHLHIDAAYGGFVKSVMLDSNYKKIAFTPELQISKYVYKQLDLLKYSDSITIDPHKHGLISYGAGAVLFKNNDLKKVILNSAPYTYHQIDKPNIGMFSLEGSRPGAMAAACYLTYKVLPPNETGVGSVIKNSIAASRKFYELLDSSEKYRNLYEPDLDINCFYPKTEEKEISAINKLSQKIYDNYSVEADNPEFILSKFIMSPALCKRVLPGYFNKKSENFTAIRSVFMKPWPALKDFYYIQKLFNSLETFKLKKI
jgi:glutamate/tyrosine decarboxylase-like PLP-dependent enzyme